MEITNDNITVPADYFDDLQNRANGRVPDTKERVAQIAQTTAVFGILAGAVTLGTWGYVKAHNWLSERNHNRNLEFIDRQATRNK